MECAIDIFVGDGVCSGLDGDRAEKSSGSVVVAGVEASCGGGGVGQMSLCL